MSTAENSGSQPFVGNGDGGSSSLVIMVDSTCDLDPKIAARYRLEIVPLYVRSGILTLRDGVDIAPQAFYELLEKSRMNPSTSPPTENDFEAAFKRLSETQSCLVLCISSEMSETSAVATRAADRLRLAQIEIVDSRTVSGGLGLLALAAARLAEKGMSAGEIRQHLERMIPRVHVLFVVNSLEYLERGGRIGKAKALLGRLLGITPILDVIEGKVTPVARIKSGGDWLARIVDLTAERIDPRRPTMFSVVHARAPVRAHRLTAIVKERFTTLEIMSSHVGPIVGAHTGPGTFGLCFFQPSEEELELLGPAATPS